jgi:hypothetical protein
MNAFILARRKLSGRKNASVDRPRLLYRVSSGPIACKKEDSARRRNSEEADGGGGFRVQPSIFWLWHNMA